MNQATFRRYGILGQMGLILIFLLINYAENIPYSPPFEALVYSLNYTFMVTGAALVHYFQLLPLYLNGRYVLYCTATLSVLTLFVVLYYAIDWSLPFDYDQEDIPDASVLIYDYLLLILILAYSSLYYFVEKWFKNITTEGQLRNEKLQAELNFLKSQINPHFLFNTLNNIYSYVQTGNPKSGPMLERLSSIMRFMVYDCSESRVELYKEITAIEDLLEIHKMKNSEQRNIQLTVEGVKAFHLVAPLIMVNFVENACKHSDVISNTNGFLNVHLSVDEKDSCLLEIANTFKKKVPTTDKYMGLGLKNIKKRLALQYGDQHQLTEEEGEGVYRLRLEIPLERKK